jgi:hypothetical protein
MAAPDNQYGGREDADGATSFLYMRATPTNKGNWVRASNCSKTKLSKWVTATLNEAAAKVLAQARESKPAKVGTPIITPK